MSDSFIQLILFSAKVAILVLFILLLLAGILSLLRQGREQSHGKISIKNINKKYKKIKQILLQEILSKKAFKKYLKELKATEKDKAATPEATPQKNIFIIHFHGDIKASAVAALREEVTAILEVAKTNDEVVVCLESSGGLVNAYGLAAAQLSRFRQYQIPLTVIVDKVAASGGYLMACVANKILAAPFAIIGSIGVIAQLPNFNRWLKEKNIDFEQVTAGNYKRTLTLFGENTQEGREKLRQEIEEIHQLFKNQIHQYRQQLDIQKTSTGEIWLGKQALELQLVDGLTTSDDYLLSLYNRANLFEVRYHIKKSFSEKIFSSSAQLFQRNSLQNVTDTFIA
ncbi:MAG: sohB [Gammaproteobacteria bacterium]|jgi:serine protease SohB|nr:sohB [Gammaproteobacteria bacterium]